MRKCRFVSVVLLQIILLMAWAVGTAAAEEAKPLTLVESIGIALQNSPLADSAAEGIKGAEAQQKESFTGFLPKLSASYSYTRINEEPAFTFPGIPPVPATTFKTGTKDNYNWNIQFRQPVYAGGGIAAAYETSKTGVDIARTAVMQTKLDIVLEVKEAYFTILRARRIMGVASQSLMRLAAHRDSANAFYEAGLIPRNDLLRAEVELAAGRQQLLRAENGVAMAEARFNTLLRRNIHGPVSIEDSMEESVESGPLDSCIAEALKTRPEVKSHQLRLDQAKSMVKQAKSEYYPNVSLIGSYERYGDTPGVAGSPYRDQENWQVTAVANWNFWEWGKTGYRIDAARSRENQADAMLFALKDQIALEVKNSFLLLQEAQKQLPVAKKAIEQAEENFRITNERYKEQVGTATDVIDAQTILTAALSDYQNHIGDLNIARARLERTMGVDFKNRQ